MAPPLIVLDTNVVAAAAMGRPDSNNSLIISEISVGGLWPAISDDYMDELVRTMSKPYVEEHASVGRAFTSPSSWHTRAREAMVLRGF